MKFAVELMKLIDLKELFDNQKLLLMLVFDQVKEQEKKDQVGEEVS